MPRPTVEYIGSETPYEEALLQQEAAVAHVLKGGGERLFFAEHPPVFTLGTSASAQDVLNAGDIPVLKTGRGGQVTYHGPGQRVVYPILDLRTRRQDLRWYVRQLQAWIVQTLGEFGVTGHITDDIGVWVETPDGLAKIAAIGIRVKKWVAFHGFALNVNPDLAMYQRIIPCGISDKPVTSLQSLGVSATLEQVDSALQTSYPADLDTR
jgi:lipoyl(octanoyl) transferase